MKQKPPLSCPELKEISSLDDLLPDNRNVNLGTEHGATVIENSLRQFGAGRSICVDREGRIISGNKTLEQAASIGLADLLVVQTQGDRLVVVQRTDLSLDDPRGRGLALADNRSSEVDYQPDDSLLAELLSELKIEEPALLDATGYGSPFLDDLLESLKTPEQTEFKEYDESAAHSVKYLKCPHCGETYPA